MSVNDGRKLGLVCIGAGKSQILPILKAKEMGWSAIAVDRNPEAPAFTLADEKIVLSTYEAEPIIAKLRDLIGDYDIRGIVNRSSGPPVITAAHICQALSLPGIPPQTAATIVNKAAFMASCEQLGIPAPRHQAVRSLNEVNWKAIRYPAILKPDLSLVGKRGVYLVENDKDARSCFSEAQASSYNGLVEIEEFMLGQDVVLISMVSGGELLPVVLLDEMNEFGKDGVLQGKGFAVPSALSGLVEEEKIYALGRQIVSKFGLDTTPLLVSVRCSIGELPRVIEIHLDLGGDLILDELLPASTDFDFVAFAIQIMVGHRLAVPSISFSPWRIVFQGGSETNRPCRWRLELNHPSDVPAR